jgi:hypothetical protein
MGALWTNNSTSNSTSNTAVAANNSTAAASSSTAASTATTAAAAAVPLTEATRKTSSSGSSSSSAAATGSKTAGVHGSSCLELLHLHNSESPPVPVLRVEVWRRALKIMDELLGSALVSKKHFYTFVKLS